MQNSLDVARFQRQKIFHLRLALFAFCLLTTALLLRFVPLFNELLSGKPPYMEVLANNVAGRMQLYTPRSLAASGR